MRILIHDYPGHPFPIQLSRELAKRGYQILHLYAGYNVTPRGELSKKPSDPDNFYIKPIFIREPLQKYNFFKRWFQEREYGRLIVKEVEKFSPDLIISSQTPLDAQRKLQKRAREEDIKFVFWLQDVIGLAAHSILRKKIPLFGGLIGTYYLQLERKLLRNSDRIILISEDFQPLMREWRINTKKTSVIPNWAPLESIPVQPQNNPWSQRYNLVDKFCFMYTGTLGMKHNPDFLLQLALHYQEHESIRVVVISEGPGADWLVKKKAKHQLDNLLLLPYQPFEQLPQVMGAASVLLALLEPDAGAFSVPSKVLTYLCAQRPLLLAIPLDNLAAKIVSKHHAGVVVSPNDIEAFLKASEKMLDNPLLCDQFACNGLTYAEKYFKIQKIGNRFEEILNSID